MDEVHVYIFSLFIIHTRGVGRARGRRNLFGHLVFLAPTFNCQLPTLFLGAPAAQVSFLPTN
jgi:aspartyl/asparaginyl beta-hydroxylase (cupin superfamily)